MRKSVEDEGLIWASQCFYHFIYRIHSLFFEEDYLCFSSFLHGFFISENEKWASRTLVTNHAV